MDTPIPWATLIDAGALYFIIGVLVLLLFRAQANTDKVRESIGKTLDAQATALELLKTAVASCAVGIKDIEDKVDKLPRRAQQ